MIWKLSYYDEVLSDVRDAKAWYFKERKGLEERFAEDVKRCIFRLQKNPFHYEIRYRKVRIALCRSFPYAVHFLINEEKKELVIIAVVHQHRHPDFPKNR